MSHQSCKEKSRLDWGSSQLEKLTIEEIKCGAILRIADAMELMAKRYNDLIAERDQYQRSRDYFLDRSKTLERSNRSLRACLKKTKKGGK